MMKKIKQTKLLIQQIIQKNQQRKKSNNYSVVPKKLLRKGSFDKIYVGINKIASDEITIKLEPLNTD